MKQAESMKVNGSMKKEMEGDLSCMLMEANL